MLLEHHRGSLPLWFAPEQIVVANSSEKQAAFAARAAARLDAERYRVVLDDRAERLSRKIVDARAAGIPILLAVGAREAADRSVALRRRDGSQETLPLAAVADALRAEAFK